MSPKGNVVHDAFEQALEAGHSAVRSSVKQIKQTFNPLDMLNHALGTEDRTGQSTENQRAKEKEQKNSTPLSFEKLQKSYEDQDKHKLEQMKQRLFQMVKGDDEKLLHKDKQKKAEKERSDAYATAEKQRKEAEKKRAAAMTGEPHGKERKSILGGKKKKKSAAEPQPAEMKPATGKQ